MGSFPIQTITRGNTLVRCSFHHSTAITCRHRFVRRNLLQIPAWHTFFSCKDTAPAWLSYHPWPSFRTLIQILFKVLKQNTPETSADFRLSPKSSSSSKRFYKNEYTPFETLPVLEKASLLQTVLQVTTTLVIWCPFLPVVLPAKSSGFSYQS